MSQPTYEDGAPRFTRISDEEVMQMAREALAKIPDSVKAMRGKFIAWIAPARVGGVIERAWDFVGNSVEAVMVSDGTGAHVPRGTLVMVRPDEGIMHNVGEVELCFLPQSALMLAELA